MLVFHFLAVFSSLSLPFPGQEPLLQICVPWSPHGRGSVCPALWDRGNSFPPGLCTHREASTLCRSQACRPTSRGSMQYLAILPPDVTLKSFPGGSMSLCTPHCMAKRSICPSRCEQKPWESLDLPSSGCILNPAPTASWWHSPAQPTQFVTGMSMFGVAGLEEIRHKAEVWESQTLQLTRGSPQSRHCLTPPSFSPGLCPPSVPTAALSPSENNLHFSFPNLSQPPWSSLPFQGMGCICSPAGLVACGQLFCLLLLYSCLRAINCLCSKVACPDDFTTWLQ